MQEMALSPMKLQEDEFEFSFLCGRTNTSPISADEIFCNGQIKPTYPLKFSPQDHQHYHIPLKTNSKTKRSARLPLKKLLSQEREWNSNSNSNSCPSSESADHELEGVSPELYCAWRPKVKAKVKAKVGESMIHMTPPRLSGCYESSYDDGSDSKRWKLKDLLLVANKGGGQGGLISRDLGKKGRNVRVASESF